MPLAERTEEIKRLIHAFEAEAGKFHPLALSIMYVRQDGSNFNRSAIQPAHAVMLWQYYGTTERDGNAENFLRNLKESELKWGIRGAELSCFGILEGEGCELFVRMAQRAGSLFDETEAKLIKSLTANEILAIEVKRSAPIKPAIATNDNPLALWLNYLLFHLSLTNPGRELSQHINPDPFTLSLLALERLYLERSIEKVDKSTQPLPTLHFEVAMSFPGEQRPYVSETVTALRPHLPADSIFYDFDYQAQLARPNVDVLLQDIYRNKANLIVIFLCKEYAKKQWSGLEWRAIRDLIKFKKDDQIMFVRFDDAPIEGTLSIDGYIDARIHSPGKLAEFILQRLQHTVP